jgi:hypothetical protein
VEETQRSLSRVRLIKAKAKIHPHKGFRVGSLTEQTRIPKSLVFGFLQIGFNFYAKNMYIIVEISEK